jgi:hypothetical protein
MANFKDLKDGPIGISAAYTAGIKVYVESNEDEYILKKKWFSDLLGKLSIEAVSIANGQDGGCQAVIKKVAEARDAGLKAFGIVDRDSLLSDVNFRESLFWEQDEKKFFSAEPFGPYIHVLMRWEIENYLLKPSALTELLRDKALAPISLATSELLENEDDLILRTSIDIINVSRGQPCPSDKFADGETGGSLKEKVLHFLKINEPELGIASRKISEFYIKETQPEARWDKLCCIINGKRSLNHLNQFFSRRDRRWAALKLEEFEKGALASHVANLKLIDDELKVKMLSFAST